MGLVGNWGKEIGSLLPCCSAASLGSWLHWSMNGEGAEAGNKVLVTVGMMEITFWDMTSLNQLNIIPEYRKYIALGSLGPNPNLH